jgi:L-iditol 2-dehydrogenase
MAEYAVMPEYNALEVPAGLDLQTAAIMEPSACCLSGLEMFEMPEDAVVLVMGGGVMGLMTAAFAKLRGARTVIMSEPIESRRNLAAELGADMVIDPTTDDLDGLISDLTDGLGAHVVCEAVGKPSLVEQAIRLTRPRGNLQLVGVNPEGSMMPADLFDVHFRELTIRGAFGGGEAYRRALDLLPQVPAVEQVVTSSYPLAQVSEAFAEAVDPAGVKVAIRPNG